MSYLSSLVSDDLHNNPVWGIEVHTNQLLEQTKDAHQECLRIESGQRSQVAQSLTLNGALSECAFNNLSWC